jgi:hypothetical protein
MVLAHGSARHRARRATRGDGASGCMAPRLEVAEGECRAIPWWHPIRRTETVSQFYQNMVDYFLQDALKMAVAEVTRLRTENEQLLADLNAVPVEMWELQEKVTSLELQLASTKTLDIKQ